MLKNTQVMRKVEAEKEKDTTPPRTMSTWCRVWKNAVQQCGSCLEITIFCLKLCFPAIPNQETTQFPSLALQRCPPPPSQLLAPQRIHESERGKYGREKQTGKDYHSALANDLRLTNEVNNRQGMYIFPPQQYYDLCYSSVNPLTVRLFCVSFGCAELTQYGRICHAKIPTLLFSRWIF